MSTLSEKALKVLLWWLVVFHGGLGLLGIFAKGSAETLAEQFFNFELELSPQTYWILNPFAAYLLAFSGFTAIAASNPRKKRAIDLRGRITSRPPGAPAHLLPTDC